MITETWKPIPSEIVSGYEASNLGRIRSLDRKILSNKRSSFFVSGKVLRPSVNKNGYKMVSLGRGKHFYVHQLVLAAFCGLIPKDMTCSHLDNNRTNNHIDNLLYESLADNIARQAEHGTKAEGEKSGHAKLKAKDVSYIRSLTNTGYGFFSKLARLYSVSSKTIEDAYKRETWKSVA